MKASELLKYLPTSDANATGHKLVLSKVYRSYKNSPHNVDALYLKYLVHRMENGKKYHSASPEEQQGMDKAFLEHHQKGGAAEKNGHVNQSDLNSFIHNPDTIKLAKQLVNHKQKLNNFILKEHPDHIININGEPHLRLTRGLGVDRERRGEEHALASYADQPDPPFGGTNPTYHHQHVPLKNIWYTYDYGPREASASDDIGPENEFLVSPHKNIYNENHEKNPTEKILKTAHHKLLATNHLAFASTRNKLSLEDIYTIVQDSPDQAAKYLKNHPLLNQSHVNKISMNAPISAAKYLKNHLNANNIHSILDNSDFQIIPHIKNHSLLNKQHIDKIVEQHPYRAAQNLHDHQLLDKSHVDFIFNKEPRAAARYLNKHPAINEKHIQYIATMNPSDAGEYFADHPLLNKEHIDTMIKARDGNRPAVYAHWFADLKNHPQFNVEHLNAIVKNDPEGAAEYFADHPLLNNKHVDFITKHNPDAAAAHIPSLNANHIQTIAETFPALAARNFNKHQLLNAQHIQTIAEKDPASAALYFNNHSLLNEQHIDTIVKGAPRQAAWNLKDHPIYKAKYGQQKIQKSFKQLTNEYERLVKADKPSQLLKYLPTSDANATGHGLDLVKVYRSYKNSPHNVDALYLKYLVHRMENGKKYHSASPEEQQGMDKAFLEHHQKGGAAEKNGHINSEDLEKFIKNPDTIKLAKQLVNHKQKLNNFILKEHPEHIVHINGEPHLRLTRGLGVDREQRGEEHALASYADNPRPPFGGTNPTYHHQHVPLKNIWYTYDYGPRKATSEKMGNEDEFLVSPHKNIYNEKHENEPTTRILLRDHHKLTLDNHLAFASTKNGLSLNDIDKIVEKDPYTAAEYLNKHKLLNSQHIDKIVENKPPAAAYYLKDHPLLTSQHIDKIVEKVPWAAAQYLKNHPSLNSQHIDKIVEKAPGAAVVYLNNHPSLNSQHIDKIVEKEPRAAAYHLNKHKLLNSQHIDKIVEKDPDAAAEYLKKHKLLNSQHIDKIVENEPGIAAVYLKNHPSFNSQHIDKIVEKESRIAAEYLKDHPSLNSQHIDKIVENVPGAAAVYLKNHPSFNSQHIDKIVEKESRIAAEYLKDHPYYIQKYGQQKIQKSFKQLTNEYERLVKADAPVVKLNPEHGKMIADAYHNMKHDPNHPEVKASYDALINETKQQYKDLLASGLKISKIQPNMDNPYPTSKHLHADMTNNNHMWYYPTSLGFGSEDSIPHDHPMLQETEFKDPEGKRMLANDVFRVVHDSIHNRLKNGFGPKGEHESFLEHKKTYSPLAQKALATETMGQNNYVNFSSQIGHLNREKPGSAYAPQKAGLMPDEIINKDWHS